LMVIDGYTDDLAWFGRANRAHYRLGLMGITPEPVPGPVELPSGRAKPKTPATALRSHQSKLHH
jgi:hypothetical protein